MSLKLYIHPKTVLFSARINEPTPAEYPRDYVDFDTVGTGTYSLIGLNMTVLIGSTAGGWDLGITRTRLAPTSSRLYIGRSSEGVRIGEVTLTDNAHITVVYGPSRVWSKVPYIDDDGVTFFDSDLAFADYSNSPPVSNAGPAVIGTIDPGSGKLAVNFSAGNSFVTMPGAAIASYAWGLGIGSSVGSFTGGTTLADQDIETEFDPGFYLVSLLVADDNAEQHTAYVPVLAINPAADPCIYNFEIVSHRIGVQGQELQVRIRQAIAEATYLDGTWVALVGGDPGDADDRSNVVFQGWIESSDEEIRATPTGLVREVTLTLVDVAGRLKALPGYSTVIEHAETPTTWQMMTTPTMQRYMHHLLQWQSNALDVADFTFYGEEDDYTFKVLSSDGASLFEQVNRRAEALIPDHLLTCNRLGQLAIGIDPMLQDSGDRTNSVQATLTPAFYSDIRYRQQRGPRVHWLRSNTILIGTDAIAAAFCIAPGNAPGQGLGATDDNEHLSLTQDDLNATTGHRYARLNAPQGLFTITLAEGDDYDLSPAALTWLQVTIDAATAAQRGLTFSEARFLMRQLDIRYNHTPTGLTKTVTIQAERETVGIPAVTVTVPAAVAVDDGGWVPAPVVPDPAFDNGLTVGQDVVGFITRQGYIYTCTDFTDAGEPTWSRNTAAATAASIGSDDLYTFVVDPFSPGYRGTPGGAINGWVAGETAVYRVTDLFGTPAYTSVYAYNYPPNLTHEWAQVAASFGQYEEVEADNPWLMVAYSASSATTPIRTFVAYSRDGGTTWSSEIDVSGHTRTAVQQERSWPALWLSPRTPGLAYVGAWEETDSQPDGGLYVSSDWGATWASASTIAPDTGQSIGFAMHVPWQSNDGQDIAYYCWFNRDTSIFKYRLYRSVAGVATEISPDDSGDLYGPARGLFSIRALDTDRQELIMAGVHDDTSDQEVGGAGGTDAVSSIWRSSDGGDTWTRKSSDLSAATGTDNVLQVAFSADSASVWYGWGCGGYLVYSDDNGATVTDKSPTVSLATNSEIMAIFGGGA